MAIEKTGGEVDVSSGFENPTTFEENGMVDHIDIDGLNQLTEYYVRGYILEDGNTTYSDNTLSFTTDVNFPAELQRVDYIESDNDCYILLRSLQTQDITTIKCKCQGYASNSTIFGSRESGVSLQLFSNNSGVYSFRYFSSTALDSNQNHTDYLEFVYENDMADFNGEQISNLNPPSQISEPIMLFGNNNSGTYTPHVFCKIYEFQTNLCHLIPCYIKPGEQMIDEQGRTRYSGECGMWDVDNNIFYGNEGNGMFIPGNDI